MKLFIDKYLHLSKELRDKQGEINAHIKLGLLQANKKEFEEGRDNFFKALELAEETGNKNVMN